MNFGRRSPALIVLSVATGALLAPGSALGGSDYLAAKKPHGGLTYRLADVASGSLQSVSRAKSEALTGLPPAGPGSLMRKGSRYVVDARVASSVGAARRRLDHLDGVNALATGGGVVTVAARAGALHRLAHAAGVESVTEQLTPMVGGVGHPKAPACQGSRTSEALTQLNVDKVHDQLGDTGSGVKVGVLSDSYNTNAAGIHAAQDITSGDLPGPGNPCGRTTPVQVLSDSAGQHDEGRAMIQAVHDLAPDANPAFSTAEGGDTVFAQHIQDLATAGARVIADDVIYFNEPMFQDGVIANAVNNVTAGGAAYFSMAFNNNDQDSSGRNVGSWEAPAFRDSGSCPAVFGSGHCMDFNPGAPVDTTFRITVAPAATVTVDLQWNQPLNGVTSDIDEGLLDSAATTVKTSSVLVNTTTQRPFELMSFTNPSGTTPVDYNIVINNFNHVANPRLKFVFFTNGSQAIQSTEYPISSGGDIVGPTIFGHNGTAGAQTVAAVPFSDATVPESYSSRGPLAHYFGPVSGVTPASPLGSPEILNKPDIAATDCAQNTFFGSNSSGVNRFCGTSQATPHAAAVGALELSADPSATNAEIKAAQTSTATAMPPFAHSDVGAGLLNAAPALGRFVAPPTVTITGAHGRVADRTPTFQFTSSRTATFTCTIDTGTAQPCSSPFTPSRLSQGAHTLTVAGDDEFGTTGLRTVSFKVDTKGPKSKISEHPRKKTHKRKAKFKFKPKGGASDLGGFKCKLDSKRFKTCTSPKKVKVKPGKHTFKVEAIDNLGNKGKVAKFRWKVKP